MNRILARDANDLVLVIAAQLELFARLKIKLIAFGLQGGQSLLLCSFLDKHLPDVILASLCPLAFLLSLRESERLYPATVAAILWSLPVIRGLLRVLGHVVD